MNFEIPKGVNLYLTTDKGRGIKSTQPYGIGDVILEKSPYVSVLYDEYIASYCAYCFKFITNTKYKQ